MRPLVYLTTRTVINGLKRATQSARRLISLLALVLWYFFAFLRPFDRGRFSGDSAMPFSMPNNSVLEAIVFAMFAMLSLLLMMGVFSYRGHFRPADVDVLFPTPVSPRLVLIFRIFRDFLFTLLLPLFLAIFFYRPASAGMAAFLAKDPSTARYVSKVSTIAWVLMALFWVCAGYALSMWANRSDIKAERNRKILGWTIAGLIVATIGYIAIQIRGMQSPADAALLAQSPFLKSVFFTATIATQMVMGMLLGSPLTTVAAAAILIGLITVSLFLDFAQVQWMYDQAASRGTDAQTLRSLQRQGDMIGLMAERARSGKLKVRNKSWIHRLRTQGFGAVIWKEIVILLRSSTVSFALTVPVVFAMVVLPVLGLTRSGIPRSEGFIGPMFLGMNVFGVFMLSLTLSQSGFIEMLRRVDLQKPLPFTSAQIVGAEVMAKVIPTTLASWGAAITAVCFRPALWPEGLAAIIGIPFAAAMICGVVLLMTVLFPDIDDPTQRGFRGLMIMLGLLVSGGPCIALFIGLRLLMSPILASFIASSLALGIFAGVTAIAGSLYAAYNPSE